MSDFVARIVDRIGEPVHIVSHSYGGLTALASVLSKKVSPLSLITFEANPIFSIPEGKKFPWAGEIDEMMSRFEDAIAKGDLDAPRIIIDFWTQPGVFNSMPEKFRNYCRATAQSNILDWRSATGFTPQMSDYASIVVPTSIVRGEIANEPIVDLSRALAKNIPNAALHIVKGAGHFLTSTHPKECAAIIDAHLTLAA